MVSRPLPGAPTLMPAVPLVASVPPPVTVTVPVDPATEAILTLTAEPKLPPFCTVSSPVPACPIETLKVPVCAWTLIRDPTPSTRIVPVAPAETPALMLWVLML